MVTTAERLHTFVNFVSEHLTGDEKGEAQTFLDRFFRAFGHGGAIEAGATFGFMEVTERKSVFGNNQVEGNCSGVDDRARIPSAALPAS